ncbi:hypothetical protein PtrV1_12299 [Pyrenophora tritici-repentis]|nr:hypothetical protein PtrV1_12299 [Pyrenophora tritici-repentis]KAF7445100.1 hypothetical protein A1F99_100860 [Pyrenophora tritici-repentis]KAF7565370.1 hypothetical protein PtrM4_048040 [Pyrenophora tritici-repentis]KAI1549864.1 hypothetical protein PtrSN001A_000611 [Pyrenophora tritici-repentis]KAI1588750.1 hypothetical protein PtrEW13061_006651 [Pyrenophora tritici-repentis]
MDLGDYDEEMENADSQGSTLPIPPLDKMSTPSADQSQRRDSLIGYKAGQIKLASSSPLSDCPSDISEENPKSIEGATAVKKTSPGESQQARSETPEHKSTTRGVAQIVKKTAKRPAKQAKKSSAPVKSSQTGSYTQGSGSSSRRRSARKANTQGTRP